MRIVLYTAAGCHNLWDEIIAQSEVALLRQKYSDAEIFVATYDSATTLALHIPGTKALDYFPNAIRSRPLKNIRAFFANFFTLIRTDLVIVGGGGLFYDDENTSFSRLISQWSQRLFPARLFRVPVSFWSIGVEVRTPAHIPLLKKVFRPSDMVTVRDEQSQKVLASIGISSERIPDSAFLFSPSSSLQKLSMSPRIGLSLRSGYLPNEQAFIDSLIRHIKSLGYTVVLMHHSFHGADDSKNDSRLFDGIESARDCIVSHSLEETLTFYPTLRFMIGMRLHSMILSALYGVPLLALSYSKKTEELLNTLEYPHRLSARGLSLSALSASLERLMVTESETKFALRRKSDTLRTSIFTSFSPLVYGLESTHAKSKGSRK